MVVLEVAIKNKIKGDDNMPKYKIGGNTYYSKDEKLRIVKKVVEEGKSSYDVAKEENISSSGMIRRWVKIYIENGYDALENKKKPGNPLSKYSNKKNLTEMEQLQYENMKLRIENERLKKGYLMKGDGSIVVFKK